MTAPRRRHAGLRVRTGAILLATGAALTVAACGSSGGSAGGGASDRTLDVVFASGISSIDPAIACSQHDYAIVKNSYDTLVRYGTPSAEDPLGELQPGLAESWEVSPDRRTYTFHLRRGVRFSSGNPLTATDVVKSFERIRDRQGCQDYVLTLGNPKSIQRIEAVDESTVRFRIARPDPLFLGVLAQTGNSPVDWRELERHGGDSRAGDDWLARNSAGTGAYAVTSYDPDNQITLAANRSWWGGAPRNDEVAVKIVGDTTTLETLVRSGESDMAWGVPFRDLSSMEQQGFQLLENPSQFYIYLGLNTAKAPLDDTRVRQALAAALPREEIAERFGYGHVELFDGPLPPAMPHSPRLSPPAPDVARAKALLAEAGVGDFGVELAVKSGESVQAEIATVLQAAWAPLGVDVRIEKLGPSAFTDRVSNFKAQAYLISDGAPLSDPAYFLGFLVKCGNAFNWTKYCNREVDGLLAKGRFDFDPGNRDRVYAQLSDLVVDDAAVVPIFAPNNVVVARRAVTGYQPTGDQQPLFSTISAG
ncbi:ABC transporter substrate-binding protein [Conexibacter arvalis]|uniref:Peptide/nickel transport system substrate-binding protein n=1 Tax=Conexibacter arvalis TaxID=912552 RepID=A0A840ICQ6_9ACTN|nr:ABC transporter substrate-binding protein [Conexibacter arvalis]MBB4662021.1 peptide/nickel transport system substrate-binding protein [Conexibacter arvalis]